jgi:hypothetical protein
VCERRPPPRERLDLEADAAAALPELVRDEAGDRDPALPEQVGEPCRDRRLTRARPAFDENLQQRALDPRGSALPVGTT